VGFNRIHPNISNPCREQLADDPVASSALDLVALRKERFENQF